MASLKSVKQIKSDGGEFVGQWHDGWQLYAYPVNAAGWRKVQLRRQAERSRGQIRSAILAWNGERLAAKQERDSIPDTLRQWVAEQMRSFDPHPDELLATKQGQA